MSTTGTIRRLTMFATVLVASAGCSQHRDGVAGASTPLPEPDAAAESEHQSEPSPPPSDESAYNFYDSEAEEVGPPPEVTYGLIDDEVSPLVEARRRNSMERLARLAAHSELMVLASADEEAPMDPSLPRHFRVREVLMDRGASGVDRETPLDVLVPERALQLGPDIDHGILRPHAGSTFVLFLIHDDTGRWTTYTEPRYPGDEGWVVESGSGIFSSFRSGPVTMDDLIDVAARTRGEEQL